MYLHDRSTIFKCFVHVQHHCSRRQREFSVNLKARIQAIPGQNITIGRGILKKYQNT